MNLRPPAGTDPVACGKATPRLRGEAKHVGGPRCPSARRKSATWARQHCPREAAPALKLGFVFGAGPATRGAMPCAARPQLQWRGLGGGWPNGGLHPTLRCQAKDTAGAPDRACGGQCVVGSAPRPFGSRGRSSGPQWAPRARALGSSFPHPLAEETELGTALQK